MKKFIFYFLFYICFIGVCFKSSLADNKSFDAPLSNKEIIDIFDNEYEIKNLAGDDIYDDSGEPKPLISADNEFLKLLIVPFVIDKLYPEEKINGDITPILERIYPTSKPERIESFAVWIKVAVGVKRRYDYVVKKLKHSVDAARIMPKDAPIIAKDGEFAPIDAELYKESGDGEYKVSYQPFKYLEYDPGDTGEPVRRRDKNYEEVEQSLLNEIMLALVRLDIAGFYRGLRKIPAYNDGSREKTVDAGDGVKARILLAENDLGDDDTVYGVFDIMVPDGFYINGDYLNDSVRPQFILDEGGDNKYNISEYEVYAPAPYGIVKDGQSRRILVGQVPIPVRFKRADVKKGIYIVGKLVFQLCDVNGVCKPVVSQHSLKMRKTKEETSSLHYNYVTQAFARLPKLKTNNAELINVEFDEKNNKLIANFDTDKVVSNISAMAEDDAKTNYINPRYIIENNKVSAIFDIAGGADAKDLAKLKNNRVAITATFNEKEVLRDVYDFNTKGSVGENSYSVLSKHISLWTLFVFGLILNLMPGIFNLFVKLIESMWVSKDSIKIFVRYALMLAIGWGGFGILYAGNSWNVVFLNVWLVVLAIFIVAAHLMDSLGYMDLALFRPLNKIFHKGCMTGIMSVILTTAFPMYLHGDVMSVLLKSHDVYFYLLCIWLGMISLPLLLLIVGRYRVMPLVGLLSFNVLYNIIYLIGALWLLFSFRGWGALMVVLLGIIAICILWYAYPFAIVETLKLTRSKKREKEIFFKVQRSFSKMFLIIYIVCCFLVMCFKPIVSEAVVVDEVINMAKELKTDDKPILVVIEGAWSPATIINRIKLFNLDNFNINVIRFSHIGENRIIDEWLDRYGRDTAPLNVLFTRRYAKGMALPLYLNDTNWNKALKDFKSTGR